MRPSRVMKMLSGFRSRWMMPAIVRRREAARDLHAVAHGFGRSQRSPRRQPGSQCLALEQLRDHEVHGAFGADVVNREDVGMVQRGHGASFALESRQRVRAARR